MDESSVVFKRKDSHYHESAHKPKRARLSPQLYDFQCEQENQAPEARTFAPLDPDYGQHGAFPGLGNSKGEELFYGPASDGLEYLQMVRSEARQVPKVLVVPKKDRGSDFHEESNDSNQGGWYADGTYIATPLETMGDSHLSHSNEGSQSDLEMDTQDAYYSALMDRFGRLRQGLSTKPPGFTASPTQKVRRSYALNRNARYAQWSYELRFTAPRAQELAASSQDDIIRAITRLEALLTRPNLLNQGQEARLSTWSWGLLAACRDIGQMNSKEVGVLRDLGKTALRVACRVRARLMEDGADSEEEEQDEIGHDVSATCASPAPLKTDLKKKSATSSTTGNQSSDIGPEHYEECAGDSKPGNNRDRDELERSKQALLQKLGGEETPIENDVKYNDGRRVDEESFVRALATLDIIVTVVGEVFGQRDLLDNREAWIGRHTKARSE